MGDALGESLKARLSDSFCDGAKRPWRIFSF